MTRILAPSLLALALAAGGCATSGAVAKAEREQSGAAAFDASVTALSERGQREWAAHLFASMNSQHQAGCAPRRHVPASRPKGVVVLFHGFSACPDQFDELGPRLAAAGLEVLVPLLPGHGRVRPATPVSEKLVDDVSALPTRDDWQRYRSFGERWAQVVAEASGAHVIAGFSVGGTVAAMAVAARPAEIDRALVIAPFLSVSNTFAKVMLGLAEGVDALLTTNPIDPMEHHWGPSCEVEREKGRGGYCSFQVNHIAAAQLSGNEVKRTLPASPRLPALQVVLIDEDTAVDSALTLAVLREATAKSPDARWCSFSKTVPHSFFSPKDRPGEPRPWLPAFLDAAERFVVQGTMFAPGACPGNPG